MGKAARPGPRRRPAAPPPGDEDLDDLAESMPFNADKVNPFLDADGQPMPGICVVCGCEEDNACEEGCCWVNAACTLCSACLAKLGPVRNPRR